jgi:pimeloyl-ACP methyl ester carboxylesterase
MANNNSHRNWILLRGLFRESRHWGSFPEILRAGLPAGDTVTAIDLPGAGEYALEPSPWTMPGIVDAVRRHAKSRGLTPPYTLLAISLGGMVALEWMRTSPEEIRDFVVLNTSDRSSQFFLRLRYQIWSEMGRVLALRDLTERELHIVKVVSNVPARYLAVAQEWARWARETPMSNRTVLAQMSAASRFRAPDQLDQPGIFLISLGDRLVDPSCTLKIAQRLGRKIVTHSWAGHDLTLDDPEWVMQSILDFLRK